LQISHHDFNARSETPFYHEDSEKQELLRISDALKKHRVEIAAFFADHTESEERGDFIKSFSTTPMLRKFSVTDSGPGIVRGMMC